MKIPRPRTQLVSLESHWTSALHKCDHCVSLVAQSRSPPGPPPPRPPPSRDRRSATPTSARGARLLPSAGLWLMALPHGHSPQPCRAVAPSHGCSLWHRTPASHGHTRLPPETTLARMGGRSPWPYLIAAIATDAATSVGGCRARLRHVHPLPSTGAAAVHSAVTEVRLQAPGPIAAAAIGQPTGYR